jgi:hypothetical protein
MRPRSEPASNKIWQEKIGFSGKAGLMAMNRAGGGNSRRLLWLHRSERLCNWCMRGSDDRAEVKNLFTKLEAKTLWRDRAGCVPVVLLYTIRRAFSFAAACDAFVWIAADARHELGEQTRCARSCVQRRGDATRDRLFSRLAAPDRLGTVAVLDAGPA